MSRYGIWALFLTSNIELAKLYADHRSRLCFSKAGGYVYQYDIEHPDIVYDMEGATTYSKSVKDLVEFHYRSCNVLLIKNALDYPSQEYNSFDMISDIYVAYNHRSIVNQQLIISNYSHGIC